MIENYIANEMLKDNSPILSEKLSKAVAELSEDNAKAISKGLFRYAVELEMIEEADAWRPDCWQMIKEREDCTFLFLTKRIH